MTAKPEEKKVCQAQPQLPLISCSVPCATLLHCLRTWIQPNKMNSRHAVRVEKCEAAHRSGSETSGCRGPMLTLFESGAASFSTFAIF